MLDRDSGTSENNPAFGLIATVCTVGLARKERRSTMPLAFAAVDWWILLACVLGTALPGFFCRKYIRGQNDFLIAGRTLSVYLSTAALATTELGLISIVFAAEMGFAVGLSGLMLGAIAGVTALGVGLTGFMVRGFRESGATTVADYYGKRYSPGVRLLGGFIIATAGILNYGMFLRPEADFVRVVMRIPDVTIPAVGIGGEGPLVLSSIKLVMVTLIVLVLLYTVVGGMVSVTLTNYLRSIVLAVSMGAVTWWVWKHPDVGGFEGILSAVREHRPGYGLNPFTTQDLVSGGFLGLGVVWVAWQCINGVAINTWQPVAFRTAAADSPRTAKIMWSLTSINSFGRAAIPMIWGLAALAYFSHKGAVQGVEPRLAMPLFLAGLPSGLMGLVMAGMLAAFMSTHAGYLLTWSGVLTEDIVAPLARKVFRVDLDSSARVWLTRLFVLMLAVWMLYWGLWFKPQSTIWNYLSVTGTIYGAGSLALVAGGLYWRRANARGAYLALLGGALPGLAYLALRVIVLAVEPETREVGHVPVHAIARFSAHVYESYVGLIGYPLGLLGLYLGSLWGERASDPATGPRIGTGSFMAAGGG